MLLFELLGGQVVQPRMRPDGVVVHPLSLDHHLRFGAVAESLDAQALVAELPVEALVVAVLPWLTGIDVGGTNIRLCQPAQDGSADELRAVVGAHIPGSTSFAHELGECLDDAFGANGPTDVDGEALRGETRRQRSGTSRSACQRWRRRRSLRPTPGSGRALVAVSGASSTRAGGVVVLAPAASPCTKAATPS